LTEEYKYEQRRLGGKEEMQRINVRIKGSRPLLMNSCQQMVMDRENEKTKKRGREEMTPTVEAERCLYKDKEGKVFVPSLCLLASLRGAAVNRLVPGRGKKTFKNYIFSGVRIEPDNIPVQSEKGWQPDLKPVVIGHARVIRARPRFDEWALECQLQIVDPIVTKADLKEIITEAGRYNGLCDFRPLYGLFEVEKFDEVKEEVA
jgi:hypothetical protein